MFSSTSVATATWAPPELAPPDEQDRINTSLTYGFVFDFCGVEIDRDTAAVRIGVPLGAVITVVAAGSYPKRRSASLSASGPGDGAAIGGAEGPDGTKAAAEVPAATADAPKTKAGSQPGKTSQTTG